MGNHMDIAKIDQNLSVQTTLKESDICFYDGRKDPFDVYGFYDYRNEPDFKRLPDEVAKSVNPGVALLYLNTAGGRVRFSTDSQYVAIHAEMSGIGRMPHIPLTGSAGFDLYVDDPETGVSRYYKTFVPPYDMKDGFDSILKFKTRQLHHFTIHFPTYSNVKNLFVGLQQDAKLGHGVKYLALKPIVYYGSSITQGGCCSRPGNAYQNVISRRLHIDHINLGFSGNGKAEDTIIEYLAELEMSAFVSDYDHNAPNVEHLQKTHCKLYQRIREKHPDLPYIIVSRPDFDGGFDYGYNYGHNDSIARRNVIYETYRFAYQSGDRNVYFVDGESIFRGQCLDMCTVDGCHPNDMGFSLMASAIGNELERAFTQHLIG